VESWVLLGTGYCIAQPDGTITTTLHFKLFCCAVPHSVFGSVPCKQVRLSWFVAGKPQALTAASQCIAMISLGLRHTIHQPMHTNTWMLLACWRAMLYVQGLTAFLTQT
jgi:hypothetical protein